MSCKACGGTSGLEACPHCGHTYCGNHRGTLDGEVACTSCLRQEHERKARAKAAKAEREERLARERARSEGEPSPGEPVELAPLPEPAGVKPVVLGLFTAGVAGGYAFWAFGKLQIAQELPRWAPAAGAAAVALVAGLGVWAIVKTRQAR